MERLLGFLVPALVATGLLGYMAYQGQLDVEAVIGVGLFLVIAVPVGIFGYRLSQKQSDR